MHSPKYIFQNNLNNFKKDNNFNIIDENDTIMDDFLIQSSFKYYRNQEFYKLVKKKPKKNIGVFHTSICSLKANSEKLQNLINNQEHQFSVITVLETLTPEGKKQNFQHDSLEGNQPYYGVKGETLKSRCRFFVKEGLIYQITKDLDNSYFENDNESVLLD